MKYKREDRVKILEYKFVFEENIQIQKEYEEGSADLNYRLSFFREKLDNQQGSKEQQNAYDKMFMGHLPQDNKEAITISETDKQGLTESASKVSNDIKPWAKKTYRQIAMVTHPDRLIGIQSKHLKDQLMEQYRIAQNAYNCGIYSDLIMVAFDLNIPIVDGVVSEEILPASEFKKKEINNIRKLLGWQWFHVPETQRDAELKKILTNFGFKFTEKEIVEVVKRKHVKRKVGTRPKNMRKQRNLNKTSD